MPSRNPRSSCRKHPNPFHPLPTHTPGPATTYNLLTLGPQVSQTDLKPPSYTKSVLSSMSSAWGPGATAWALPASPTQSSPHSASSLWLWYPPSRVLLLLPLPKHPALPSCRANSLASFQSPLHYHLKETSSGPADGVRGPPRGLQQQPGYTSLIHEPPFG